MKMSVGKRILMLLHWLFSLALSAAFAVCLIAPGVFTSLYERLDNTLGPVGNRIAAIALLVLYVAVACVQICLILNRKKRVERGFIVMESSETGRVRIAVSAIEQLVRQSVRNLDGITEMKIDIDGVDDALIIAVNASIAQGSHVPTLTANMQRAIRSFVENNCGVSVRTVSISINSVANVQEASRRRFGRAKAGEEASLTVGTPDPQPASGPDEAPEAPVVDVTQSDVLENVGEASEKEGEALNGAGEAYDPDQPYESEFLKDLERMRVGDSDASEDPDESARN